MKLRVLALGSLSAAVFLHCVNDDYTPPTLTFDGSARTPDANAADASAAETDAIPNVPDALEGGVDAGADADAEAGPLMDDAGCPLATGTLPDPVAAGIPAAGLVLWLLADRGVRTLVSGAMCRWDDMSGKGQAFVPATATPPALLPTGLKNKPAMSFGAAEQHLRRAGVLGIAPTAGRTFAVIGEAADTIRGFRYVSQALPASPGTSFALEQNTSGSLGSLEGMYITNNSYDANIATSIAPRTHVLSIGSFEPGGVLPNVLSYAIDGVAVTLTRTPVGAGNGLVEGFAPATETFLGQASPGFTGAVLGEVLVYDRALTEPERIAVEQYLAARFR